MITNITIISVLVVFIILFFIVFNQFKKIIRIKQRELIFKYHDKFNQMG